ncbi:MAG: EAL domain-containing protein [Cellvibrionaceae bacterium]|nr:EAL domain-containing protein [Cellvibrionaceae bacterium]
MMSKPIAINFKNLVESSLLGVFYADQNGDYQYANTAWQKIFGLSPAVFRKQAWLAIVHSHDREEVAAAWRLAVAEQVQFCLTFRLCLQDCSLRTVCVTAAPEYEGNQLRGFFGYVEDVTQSQLLQQHIIEKETSYSRLLSHLSGIAYRGHYCGTRFMAYVSPGFKELTGFDAENFLCEKKGNFASLIHDSDSVAVEASIKAKIDDGGCYRCEYRIVVADNVIKWVWDQGEGIFDQRGNLQFVEGLMTDITSQKLTEFALRNERNLLLTVINSSPDLISAKDKNLRLFLCNEAYAAAKNTQPEQLYGKSDIENGVSDVLVKGDLSRGICGYEQEDLDALGGKEVHNHRDCIDILGEQKVFDTVKLPIKNGAEDTIGVLAVARDITEVSLAAEKIWFQANYDALTQLPNRSMFSDRLREQIKKSFRDSSGFAILFIDLDRFKSVNDTFGHEAGDLLLTEVASRITKSVRNSDTVSRFAGDEFNLLLPDVLNPFDVQKVAEAVHDALSLPINLQGERVMVSASIGAAIFPTDSQDSSELMRFADQAMYQAKRSGRGKSCFFTPQLQKNSERRSRMVAELRCAIERQQLELYFQPIVDLNLDRVLKAEALVRWQHPTLGLLSPNEFISLAEEEGLIVDIGNWVFKTAAQKAKSWRANYHPDFQVSINKSPLQFCEKSDFEEINWAEFLSLQGLPGRCLSVEIREGVLNDEVAEVGNKLLAFRNAGIQVSLEHFGTGQSSLSYLKKFDISYIKIDRLFVNNIVSSDEDRALCEAMVLMAHKLGLKVVAEGVETAEQYASIQSSGCDYAQGYYLAKPMSAAKFEEYIMQ